MSILLPRRLLWKNHEKDLANWASAFKLSYLCSLAQQLLNMSFHYKVHLHTNRTIHLKMILKLVSCYNIIFKGICGSIMGNYMSIIGKIPGIAGIA